MADIYIGSLDGKTVLKFPFVPTELPKIARASNSEVFETFSNGSFSKPQSPELRTIPLEGKLPLKKYAFSKSTTSARAIIALLETAQDKKEPVRLTIYRNDGSKYINTLATVENFEYSEGVFLNYSIEFKECRDNGNLQIASKLNRRT